MKNKMKAKLGKLKDKKAKKELTVSELNEELKEINLDIKKLVEALDLIDKAENGIKEILEKNN